jgi:dihydroxyacetone kinase
MSEVTRKPMLETPVATDSEQLARRRKSALPALLKAFQRVAEESASKIAETAKQETEKLAKVAAQIALAIREEQGDVDRDDERVRAIITTGLPGFERMLRSLPVLNQGDNRDFMRAKKWRLK